MAYVKLRIIKRSKCDKHGDMMKMTNVQNPTFLDFVSWKCWNTVLCIKTLWQTNVLLSEAVREKPSYNLHYSGEWKAKMVRSVSQQMKLTYCWLHLFPLYENFFVCWNYTFSYKHDYF